MRWCPVAVAGRSPPSPIKEEDSESSRTSPGLAHRISRAHSGNELPQSVRPPATSDAAAKQAQAAGNTQPAAAGTAAVPQRLRPAVVPPLALGPVRMMQAASAGAAAAAATANPRAAGLPPLAPPVAQRVRRPQASVYSTYAMRQ